MASSSYSPPTIGVSGLTVPDYAQVLDYLTSNFKSIYGQNVYLGNDSADFQLISLLALVIADTINMAVMAYNNRSPLFAIGAALDAIVRINGITRKAATASTCQVTLTGTAGTIITNGIVGDVNGNLWDLPSSVTIGGGGSVMVTATCRTAGAVSADVGQLIVIQTPTSGWTSVTNSSPAVVGQPLETDSQLRSRQALSTLLPSITLLAGTVAGIAAVQNVTRHNVLENPTSAVDADGNPPHSITAVVEGGLDVDVATAIYNNRGIGCFTNSAGPNGSPVTVDVTDSATGIVLTIGFERPAYVPIYVSLTLHPLTGYTTAVGTQVQQAVVDYLNSLQIGETLTLSGVYAAAMSVTPNISLPLYSIRALTMGVSASPTGTSDITVDFDQVVQGLTANVVISTV